MTLLMLLLYMLLGALLAWPCWLLLRRAQRARQPLRCVKPYRPGLPQTDVAGAPTPPSAPQVNE